MHDQGNKAGVRTTQFIGHYHPVGACICHGGTIDVEYLVVVDARISVRFFLPAVAQVSLAAGAAGGEGGIETSTYLLRGRRHLTLHIPDLAKLERPYIVFQLSNKGSRGTSLKENIPEQVPTRITVLAYVQTQFGEIDPCLGKLQGQHGIVKLCVGPLQASPRSRQSGPRLGIRFQTIDPGICYAGWQQQLGIAERSR